jgi:hypothetical protein
VQLVVVPVRHELADKLSIHGHTRKNTHGEREREREREREEREREERERSRKPKNYVAR